jgi:DNA polymerase-3 subunit epsilon
MALPPITIFDTETTGLDPKKGHRVVEIAGIRIENGVIDESKTFVSLVNPERPIPWETRQIHKIGDEDVKDAPTIMTVLPQFLEFAQGTVLLAHNANFDLGFLQCEKEFCWGYVELPEILCTMRLSQNLYPTAFRHNLDTLCEKFGLTIPPDRHRALTDVILTGQVLLKMLESAHIQSLDELRRKAALTAPPVLAPRPSSAPAPRRGGW